MPNDKNNDSTIVELLKLLKLKYLDGQNTLGRAQVTHGMFPTKNAATNFGALMTNSPVDRDTLIRKNDPANNLRQLTSGVGRLERIHNTYIPSRVKLAD